MRTRIGLLVLTLVAVSGLALAAPAIAQDDMTHTCDSTLILLLYLAEHYYGYHPMMDVSTFEKGQYAPLFDAMMEGEEMMATEEAMMESEEMMATEEAMMMEGDMTMLTPATIEGEDPACTALRAELDTFFYTTLTSMMMEDM